VRIQPQRVVRLRRFMSAVSKMPSGKSAIKALCSTQKSDSMDAVNIPFISPQGTPHVRAHA
jgi:hypothetical protein